MWHQLRSILLPRASFGLLRGAVVRRNSKLGTHQIEKGMDEEYCR